MKAIILGTALILTMAGCFCTGRENRDIKPITIHNWDGCASCWAALMEDSGHGSKYYQNKG